MVARPLDSLDTLAEAVAVIFDQAQLSLANHRKNCVALYKLHHQAAAVTQKAKNGRDIKYVGERKFGDAFLGLVNRVLVVKKGPAAADRVIRFIGSYVKFVNEKAAAEKATISNSISTRLDDNEDTFASRFVRRLLNYLLEGFLAKNKITRYRCICVVSEMISHLGEIDEDAYNLLKDGLIDRICDKETPIRAYAATALSKLAGSEDPDEVAPGEKTILDVLSDVISYDPAPEVRRASMISLPLLSSTTDTILTRTRDTDALTRKLVYSNVLQTKLQHPRQLTIAQREQVIKDGLGDREPSVRVAAGKLAASWFDIVTAEVNEAEDYTWDGDDGGIMKGFLRFLTLFDVVGSREAIAVDAVLSIFVTRPNIPDVFVFPEVYWKELTPEAAVLARVFLEHCLSTKNETRIDAAQLPVGNLDNPDTTQSSSTKDKSTQRAKLRDDMSPEERMQADITDMRCLSLCIGMLERVDGSFEDNSTLEGILADLIIPSVKRKEISIREKGLISLGLCCLIAKVLNMALSSFQLFLGQVQTAPEELKLRVLQVIFDLLIVYDQEFFSRSDDIAKKITGFLVQNLEVDDSPAIQAVLCVGLSKLLLSGIVKDAKVLSSLVLTYVSPTTRTNEELRQCLSYFFPVYCYSSSDNQARMQSIFVSTFDLFMQARENLDDDQDMITPFQFGLLLVDWTNPQKRAEM
ncbi:hypothetical protein H0H87_011119 [Tephrocybe sp. NHM501043]|nr:hypothetical protein H0H87_011119 [Tephrocybe sp. NHM501043]